MIASHTFAGASILGNALLQVDVPEHWNPQARDREAAQQREMKCFSLLLCSQTQKPCAAPESYVQRR